jgi:hypothetical protein
MQALDAADQRLALAEQERRFAAEDMEQATTLVDALAAGRRLVAADLACGDANHLITVLEGSLRRAGSR